MISTRHGGGTHGHLVVVLDCADSRGRHRGEGLGTTGRSHELDRKLVWAVHFHDRAEVAPTEAVFRQVAFEDDDVE